MSTKPKVKSKQDGNMPQETNTQWSVLENAPIAMLVSNATDGKVLFANERVEKLLGLPPQEFVGRITPDFYFNPDDREIVLDAVREQGYLRDFELHIKRQDGTPLWVMLSIETAQFEGKPALLSGILDITERKQAEQDIRESEARFRTLFEDSADAYLILDNNIFVDCNQATVEMLRMSNKKEALSTHPSQLSPEFQPDGRPSGEKADEMIRIALEQGSNRFEWMHRRGDGEDFLVEVLLTPIPVGDKTVIHTVWRDITERKQAEQAIRESQERLDLALKASNAGVWEFWPQDDKALFSERWFTMLGYEPNELPSSYATWRGLLHPDDLERTEAIVFAAVESGDDFVTEFRMKTRDGAWRWIHDVGMTVEQIESGATKRMIGTHTDITEQKRLQAQVQEAFERRGDQVQLSTEISQEIAQASGLDELFNQVVALTKERLGYYHTQLLRYDPGQDAVVLIAGYGKTGQKMLAEGHQMHLETGLIRTAAATGETVMRSTLAEDPDWQPNPLLPDTRGEIAVPIKFGEQVLGVLDIQSNQAGAITEDDRLLLEGLCGQIAITMDQTRLRQEIDERLQEINHLYRTMSREGWQRYRETGALPEGFQFDQVSVRPVEEPNLTEQLFAKISMTLPGGEVLGEVSAFDDPQNPLSEEDKVFIGQVSEQVALALESARLVEETQQASFLLGERVKELDCLNDIGHKTEEAPPLAEFLHWVTERIPPAMRYPDVCLATIELDDDIYGDNNTLNMPYKIMGGIRIGGKLVGGVHIAYTEDHPFIDEESALIGGIVRRVSGYIENQRLLEQTEKRAAELQAVAEVTSTASTELDTTTLLQAIVNLTKERFDLYHAHIYLLDEIGENLTLVAGAGEIGAEMVAKGWQIPLEHEHSLVAQAARTRTGVIVNDVRETPNYLPNPLLPHTRSEMAIPLLVGGELLGVMDVQSSETAYFTDEDLQTQTTLATQAAVALQNANLYVAQAATVERLKELDILRSAFLANMSHELRTPLNSILGFTEVILQGIDGPLTEPMEQDLGVVYKNGKHLLNLINEVLDMAKIESGKMNLLFETTDLWEIINDVIITTTPLAAEKSLEILFSTDKAEKLTVEADQVRFQQVMLNIMGNAIKFTEKGKISINAHRSHENVLISVRDTGLGIPEDYLEAIFESFQQVDTSTTRKAGGTGLGLPISKHLIEMHGGKLWAESEGEGKGSVFFIELPIHQEQEEAIEADIIT